MYTFKQVILRGILFGELVLFFGFYLFGSRGIPLLRILHGENNNCMQDIMQLEEEINLLQKEIDEWHAYPFYQEKVAREELQLINPGDTVYFIK